MRATLELEFNLPDDEEGMWAVLRGAAYLSALRAVDNHCREQLKYRGPTKQAAAALEAVRRVIREEVPDLDGG